jgi:hypothetical protein
MSWRKIFIIIIKYQVVCWKWKTRRKVKILKKKIWRKFRVLNPIARLAYYLFTYSHLFFLSCFFSFYAHTVPLIRIVFPVICINKLHFNKVFSTPLNQIKEADRRMPVHMNIIHKNHKLKSSWKFHKKIYNLRVKEKNNALLTTIARM